MSDTILNNPGVREILGEGISSLLDSTFAEIAIAEEEIAAVRGTDEVDRDDPVWGAFLLLQPTHELMRTEFVYRAHCREILRRVSDGEDTRPGTDAEMSCAISDASMRVPLHGAVVLVQARIFHRTFPEKFEQLGYDLDSNEKVHGAEADEWETTLRHKARQEWRKSTAAKDAQ